MDISCITKKIIAAKEAKGLTFIDLAKQLGKSEIWTSALIYGQAQATREEAKKLCEILGLDKEAEDFLADFPNKGLGPVVPTDPLIYRLYVIMQVYGYPLTAVIHEKFGDGIMSAIDFDMEVDRVENPKGDRIRVTMTGKYLPYKIW